MSRSGLKREVVEVYSTDEEDLQQALALSLQESTSSSSSSSATSKDADSTMKRSKGKKGVEKKEKVKKSPKKTKKDKASRQDETRPLCWFPNQTCMLSHVRS